MKKILTFLILLSNTITKHLDAQEIKYAQDATLLTSFSITQLTGGCIILKARIDNFKDTLNFVLDTGSGGISLDSSTVDNLKLTKTKSLKNIRGIAGIKNVEFALKHTLQLPNLAIDSLDFHINNYEMLTASYGVKIDGIIGYSFLRQFIVKINYENNEIKIYSPGNLKYPKYGYVMQPKFTPLPIDNFSVNDHLSINTNLIFDTGAGLNLLFSEKFITESKLLHKKKHFYTIKTEGLGGQKLMKLSTIKSVVIGKYKFKNVPIMIFEDDYNITNYPLMGGVVGNDILRRFNVIINYPNFTIHLQPNKFFSDPFDYSYTGLSIYLIDNKITIVDVMDNSPAKKAGLREGDEIFAVNNMYTGSLQSYKTAIQNSENKIKIIILRNGKPLNVTLSVQNIKK